MIYTVFPKINADTDMPQDFSTYEEALEYAERNYYPDEYDIEVTTGDVV